MNTVDSTNIDTPIIGLVIEDAWNDGRVIIPAGTEVHGLAQKSPSSRAHRFRPPVVPGFSGRQGTSHLRHGARLRPEGFRFLGRIGRLRGPARIYREVRQIRRSQGDSGRDDFRGSGRVPGNGQRSSRRSAARRSSTMAGSTAPSPRGCKPEGNFTRSVFWSGSTRTLSTSAFPRAPRSTSTSRKRSIWARPRSAFPLPFHRQTTRLSTHEILSRHYPALSFRRVRHEERNPVNPAAGSPRRQRLRRQKCRKSARRRR